VGKTIQSEHPAHREHESKWEIPKQISSSMTTLQKTLIAVAFAVLAGTGIYQAFQAAQLGDKVLTLQQQKEALAEQNLRLEASLAGVNKQVANLVAENAQLKSNQHEHEISQLRGKVAQLESQATVASGAQTNDPLVSSWIAKRDMLKQIAATHSDQYFFPLKWVTEEQWIDIARQSSMSTEEEIANVLNGLQGAARSNFYQQISAAGNQYIQANNGRFPNDLYQLTPYFSAPLDQTDFDGWKSTIEYGGQNTVGKNPSEQFMRQTLQNSQGNKIQILWGDHGTVHFTQ
jgi:hypothetical protein